ncbi:MAG: DUF4400 domain-containing protein [Pseudomonadota bacterium]
MSEARAVRATDRVDQKPVKEPGKIGRVLGLGLSLLSAVFVAMAASIIIEWLGIALNWWGVDHAQRLLETERSYIEKIDAYPSLVVSPYRISADAVTRVDAAAAWMGWEGASEGYLAAAINIAKLISLRLAVCLFTLPAFLLVALVALLDGMVSRDIRKFTGGHESSYVFHKAKRFVIPSLLLTITVYLMIPFSIPPVAVFAPALCLAGVMIYIATSRFKKFL